MRKQLISFAQVINLCKISSSRGRVNPKNPRCVRPWQEQGTVKVLKAMDTY